MQVGFTQHSTLTFGVSKTSLGLGLTYSHLAFWGFWCIPITIYAFLPQLALVNSRPLFPKVGYYFFIVLLLFLFLFEETTSMPFKNKEKKKKIEE